MRYVPQFDGLRSIAVVAVILFHSNFAGPVPGGFIGVDLFFVLSAFLISSKLAEEYQHHGSLNLGRFYLQRALRLVPALLLMLSAYLIIAPVVWKGHHVRDAAITAAYLADLTYPVWQMPLYLRHTWSLAIEEQFYLLWPFLLVPLIKARRPLIWLGGALAMMMAWRLSFPDWHVYYYRPDTHATGLIIGAMLFFSGLKLGQRAAYVGLVAFAAVCLIADIRVSNGWIPFAEIAAVLLIASADQVSWLSARPLVHIGKLSYAMYLWHFPIACWARSHFGFAETAAITLTSSYALAFLSYYTVEAWGRKTKRQMTHRSLASGAACSPQGSHV